MNEEERIGPRYTILDPMDPYTCSFCKDKFPFRPHLCKECSKQKKKEIILCSSCDYKHTKHPKPQLYLGYDIDPEYWVF